MTLEALGNIGDFLGGIGVVITLIYLARQIRQNTDTVRAAGIASHDDGFSDINNLLAGDASARRVYWDGMSDYEALSDDDRRQFDMLCSMFLNTCRRGWELHRVGAITDDMYRQTVAGLRFVATQPGFREFWSVWSGIYESDFGELVADEVAKPLPEQSVGPSYPHSA